MPRYIYRCSACREQFEINHGMFHEQRQCIKCKRTDTIAKVPSFRIKKNTEVSTSSKGTPGKIVDDFIEEAKKDLKQQRKDLKTEYKDK